MVEEYFPVVLESSTQHLTFSSGSIVLKFDPTVKSINKTFNCQFFICVKSIIIGLSFSFSNFVFKGQCVKIFSITVV